MISLHQLTEGVVLGLFCMALGLVPGMMENLVSEVYTLAEKLAPGFPISRPQSIKPPLWFAIVGGVIVFLTMLVYLLPAA